MVKRGRNGLLISVLRAVLPEAHCFWRKINSLFYYFIMHMACFCYPDQLVCIIPRLLVFLADGRDFLKAFPLSLGSIWSVLAFGEIPPPSIVVAVVDFRFPSVTVCRLENTVYSIKHKLNFLYIYKYINI